MKSRKVLTRDSPQVEALQASSEAWIPLAKLSGLDKISKALSQTHDLSKDLLAVLALGKHGWELIEAAISDYKFTTQPSQISNLVKHV